jgi:hypothetical protein
MVLDPAGVLAHVVLAELLDRFEYEVVMRPEAGFAGADDALVGVDADEQATLDQERCDLGDLHRTLRWVMVDGS